MVEILYSSQTVPIQYQAVTTAFAYIKNFKLGLHFEEQECKVMIVTLGKKILELMQVCN
jgi:hypothetical protein